MNQQITVSDIYPESCSDVSSFPHDRYMDAIDEMDESEVSTHWQEICTELDIWARRAASANGFGGF